MVVIAKSFDDDMDNYLDKLYGKKERYSDTVKKKKAAAQVQKVPDNISEEEVFVEYEDAKPTFKDWLNNFFSGNPKSRIPDESDVPLEDLPPETVKELEAEEAELEEVEEEIGELEERREGILMRFFNTLRGSRKSAEVYEDDVLEDVPLADEDVKEVLKRLHVWIEKLPNREMREFKISEDFEMYKSLLKKYGLIK